MIAHAHERNDLRWLLDRADHAEDCPRFRDSDRKCECAIARLRDALDGTEPDAGCVRAARDRAKQIAERWK